IIFSQQMKDFFGLQITGKVPGEFIGQWESYLHAFRASGINYASLGIAVGGVMVMNLLRRLAPKIPGAIVAVVLATVVVGAFGLDRLDATYHVETIGTRFGTPECPSGIPQTLPHLRLPSLDANFFKTARELVPSAGTIALLAAIESLLCCVVADGMIGGRHKSNCELVAQGTANIFSIFFGGIPATGAIARTAANIKSGGRTPLAGMIHAVVLLFFMLLLAPYLGKIPLAVFASVLVMVAWNMSERDHFRNLFKAPKSDIVVLLLTFGLTVFVDLTVAVGIGLVMASFLFMKRMSEVTNIGVIRDEIEESGSASEFVGQADPNSISRRDIPAGIEVYEINGPFFFGAADMLKDTLRELEKPPKVFILRMRRVPAIDATGMHALDEFLSSCKRQGTRLLLAGVHAQPIFALTKYGMIDKVGEDNMFENIDDALNCARNHIGLPPKEKPQGTQAEVARGH
ncbi:MAG: SulP family inorganic anion transporter, partial [archaeon]